jgi:tetratricopeptide (TPR) repeat protein
MPSVDLRSSVGKAEQGCGKPNNECYQLAAHWVKGLQEELPLSTAKTAIVFAATTLLCCVATNPALSDPYAKAARFYAAHQFSQAAPCFEEALRINPAHSTALYYDAACYQQMGQTERARALYQLIVSVFPSAPSAALAKRQLAGLEGHSVATPPAQAATALSAPPAAAASPLQGPSIDDQLAKARALQDVGQYSEAERCYLDAQREAETLGSMNGKLAAVLGQMGDFYAAKGDTIRACKAYRRELQINERVLGKTNPVLADRMTAQANTFLQDGDAAFAEDLLRRSLDIYQGAVVQDERNRRPTKADANKVIGAMSSLANVLRQSGRAGEAKALDGQVRMMTLANQ